MVVILLVHLLAAAQLLRSITETRQALQVHCVAMVVPTLHRHDSHHYLPIPTIPQQAGLVDLSHVLLRG